ncbi:hypothetical protein RA29_03405 [Tateyamaria sp. ANG-S1]|nr:hypothetical protein RA29_03405 [Tateyamaria sp. ANG-S1]
MKTGSLSEIHPAIRPVTAGRWGFTLHMAQLSSLPCAFNLGMLTLMLGEQIQLHLAKQTPRGVRGV